ncbi:kinesin-related protein 10-like [Phymastichus coffea]|uniref:kinesin-related protein 10-like n=1 Tax=Phymastichus coffea TaxID=108790 RepID=UPI00273CD85C|nr:kinesin-related protein 10-like [Phymastichus coffea]
MEKHLKIQETVKTRKINIPSLTLKKYINSNKHGKESFDKRENLETVEDGSKEHSSEEIFQSLRHNQTQNFTTMLSKKDNSKIKSLLKNLSKSSCHKKLLNSKDENKIDLNSMQQETVIKNWQKLKNIIKSILIDNYKLEVNLLQKYYLLKKDLSQTINVAKQEFRIFISKQDLSKKKIYDVERLYINQFKDQIIEKVFAFKQSIRSEIDKFQLELKSATNHTKNHHEKSTAILKEISTLRPFDSVFENETIIDHEVNVSPSVKIISADHIASSEILNGSLTGTNEYINHFDNLTDFNSVLYKNSNRITIEHDSKSSKNTKLNSELDGNMHKVNKFMDSLAGGKTPSLKIDIFPKLNTASKINSPAISAYDQLPEFSSKNILIPSRVSTISKNEQPELTQPSFSIVDNSVLVQSNSQDPTVFYSHVTQHPLKNIRIELQKNETSKPGSKAEIENGIALLNGKTVRQNNDTLLMGNKNLQQRNLTVTHTDKVAVTAKNEIDTNLRNNATKSISSAVSDNAGSSGSLTHVRNTFQIKNMTTDKNITIDAENSANFDKFSQIDHPETSIVNNGKLIKPINDSHRTENSLLVDQQNSTEIPNNNIIAKNEVNDLDQHNIIDIGIPNSIQESHDVTLINSQINDTKFTQNPREANLISTESSITTKQELNRVIDNVSDIYDSEKHKSTLNVTNVYANSGANSRTNNSSIASKNLNETVQTTIAYNTEIPSYFNQAYTMPTLFTENVDEHKTVKPIDGNIENITVQNNYLIPYDVNTEKIQSTSDFNKILEKSDVNKTNAIGLVNSIDNNVRMENSHLLLRAETTSGLQNDEKNITTSEKQDVNDIASEFITTSYLYESTTPFNNNDEVKFSRNRTTYNGKIENIPFNYSDSNQNVNFTDMSVSQTIPIKNITRKSSNLNFNDSTAGNIDQLIKNQSKKITQINPSTNNNSYNEVTTPYSSPIIGEDFMDQIVINDTIKVLPNKTSAIDSTSYANGEITTNLTKNLDNSYLSVATTSSLNISSDKDFGTELKVEKTVNDNKITSSTVSTLTVDSQILHSNLNETIPRKIRNGKNTTNTISEEKNISTTLIPDNKINSTVCTDVKGAVVDCESLILPTSGSSTKTNVNIENKKPTMNLWPGVPHACLSLFLASDGNVLKEIPSTVNIADAQTRNLCLSIAKTVIQLNSLSSMK